MFTVDYTNVRQEVVGTEHGIDIDFAFTNYSQKISDILKDIKQKRDNGFPNYLWIDCYKQNEAIQDILEYAEMVKGKFDDILIIGNGTTVFGIEVSLKALLKPFWNSRTKEERSGIPRIHFLKYLDPDSINEISIIKDMKRCLVIITSKDCANPAAMSIFMMAKRRLEYEVGENHRMHILITTVKGSVLEQIAYQEGYKCFTVPENLGFNLFSSVILAPLALAGISTEEFLSGVQEATEHMLNTNLDQNPMAQVALIHHLLKTQRSKYISVIMPYSRRLQLFAKWFSYLIEERLTRDINNDNIFAPHGQICLGTQGSGDQSSLIQMLAEGPNDKQITLVKVGKFQSDNTIPDLFKYTSIGYLGGKTLTEIINAETESLKMLLVDKQRPNITLTIPEINPYEIGSFMTSIVFGVFIKSYLYNINPFNMPQHEQMHDYICAQLGRYGYEHTLEIMKEKQSKITALSAPLV